MNVLDYKTYEEAAQGFSLDERWDLVEGNEDSINIAHECVERHKGEGTAVRLKFSDGSTRSYTYSDVSRKSSQFAYALEDMGVERGDRVALMLHPSIELYSALYGTIKRGALAVPGSPLLGPEGVKMRLSDDKVLFTTEEIAETLDISDGMKIITPTDFNKLIEGRKGDYEPVHSTGDDIMMIQYSAGTTGVPKPVEYPQKALPTALMTAFFCIGLRSEDRYFNPSPPSWGFGIWYGAMSPLALGSGIGSYHGKFNVERILEALEEFEINNFSAVPTAIRNMVYSDISLSDYDSHLDKLSYTGGAMTAEQFEDVKKAFGIPPAGLYGSTEVGVIIANYVGFEDWEYKAGSLGKPLPSIEAAVIDKEGNILDHGETGEIAVKLGGKWRRVGDLGVVDEDGYFWHKGRADDVIISSGYTIGPQEVEEPLHNHEAIKEAAAVGVPNETRGKNVKAFIVLNEGYEPSKELAQEIRDYAKREISKHAYPREIEFIEEMPRTESGKLQRKELGREE